MLYGNLKKTLRLNRTIGGAFLFYAVFPALMPTWTAPPPFWATLALGVSALAFIAANELARAMLKQFGETESQPFEKVSVFLPIILLSFISWGYLLTGQTWTLPFLILPALQAQFFGHTRMARTLALAALGLALLGVTLGYPHEGVMTANPLHATLARVAMAIPLTLALFHYGSFVSTLVRSTSSQVTHLQSLATTDGLTGLINRRQFNHRLHAEMARARRHHAYLTLALFDIDNFKRLNDFYGHPVGDRILKELGALLLENVRESDVAARYGGEEFALILPETRQGEAYELLERLRATVERHVFCLPDNPLTLTLSVGFAELDLLNHTAFELVEVADAALYEAKHQGKNRVIYGAPSAVHTSSRGRKSGAPPRLQSSGSRRARDRATMTQDPDDVLE
ncbi:MAG: GGDEF domain-containing protein [Vampirovibrionales bacterium]|nr:GGDEF domain-containing protein [Vampirovibrionales bacterium]